MIAILTYTPEVTPQLYVRDFTDNGVIAMDKNLQDFLPELLNIWTVLETLNVSLERITTYTSFSDELYAHKALWGFMDSTIQSRITTARDQIVEILDNIDTESTNLREQLINNKDVMYWTCKD
ncbi:hypothetical protein H0W32_02485 [Patescibacteria group bacterium]|nr:hypothetical protein [Patescibacteria group bacterium]